MIRFSKNMERSCAIRYGTDADNQKLDNFSRGGDLGELRSLVAQWRKYIFAFNKPLSAKQAFSHMRFFLFNQHISQIDQITRPAVKDFVIHLKSIGYSPSTVQHYLAAVSSFCTFLLDQEILTANPCAKVKQPRIIKKRAIYYDKEEQQLILSLAKLFGVYYQILIGMRAGLRKAEIRFIRWQDMDFSRRVIIVDCFDEHTAKSKRPRVIPMHNDILEMQVFAHKQGFVFSSIRKGHVNKPMSERYWQLLLAPMRKYVKINNLPIKHEVLLKHLRSTFGSMAVQAGIHPQKLQQWLGHSSITTTINHYANIGPDKFDDEINKI